MSLTNRAGSFDCKMSFTRDVLKTDEVQPGGSGCEDPLF